MNEAEELASHFIQNLLENDQKRIPDSHIQELRIVREQVLGIIGKRGVWGMKRYLDHVGGQNILPAVMEEETLQKILNILETMESPSSSE